jgi:hypothetical protein
MQKNLPPDAELQRLAAAINAKLEPGIAINFFRIEREEGDRAGAIFQCGDRRITVLPGRMLYDSDVDDLLSAITTWVAQVQYQHRWTLDPKEAT